MILSSKSYLSKIDINKLKKIKVYNNEINYVTEAKSLGVWIDDALTFKVHIGTCREEIRICFDSLMNDSYESVGGVT